MGSLKKKLTCFCICCLSPPSNSVFFCLTNFSCFLSSLSVLLSLCCYLATSWFPWWWSLVASHPHICRDGGVYVTTGTHREHAANTCSYSCAYTYRDGHAHTHIHSNTLTLVRLKPLLKLMNHPINCIKWFTVFRVNAFKTRLNEAKSALVSTKFNNDKWQQLKIK